MNEINITCEDCMKLMSRYPNNHFDLAIVDPPYGCAVVGGGGDMSCITSSQNWLKNERGRFGGRGGRFDKYKIERTGGTWVSKYGAYINHWDIAPEPEYFNELFRVSKNQIIWGGNYFDLPPSRNFIVWRKLTISENFSMAMAEYAWTSICGNAKIIECAPQDKERFHPTQKPVYLYKKLLQWYSKPGYKILDTHLGSGSIAIACSDFSLSLTACEIDIDYYSAAMQRVKEYQKQQIFFSEWRAHEQPDKAALYFDFYLER
ncbi:MAG: site-specific DNA-methyltransferase [Treponema sp.]|nr:site-specific DNA-methyltransferase [Treponema sp.]